MDPLQETLYSNLNEIPAYHFGDSETLKSFQQDKNVLDAFRPRPLIENEPLDMVFPQSSIDLSTLLTNITTDIPFETVPPLPTDITPESFDAFTDSFLDDNRLVFSFTPELDPAIPQDSIGLSNASTNPTIGMPLTIVPSLSMDITPESFDTFTNSFLDDNGLDFSFTSELDSALHPTTGVPLVTIPPLSTDITPESFDVFTDSFLDESGLDFSFKPVLDPAFPQDNIGLAITTLNPTTSIPLTTVASPFMPCDNMTGSNTVPISLVESAADTGAYSCTNQSCSERFTTPQKLQKHKRESHVVRTNVTPGIGSGMSAQQLMERNSQRGPYKCGLVKARTGKPCNAIFTRPHDLTRHEDMIHNPRKQKPRCKFCTDERTFARKDSLARHIRNLH